MQTNEKPKRNTGLDLLRLISMFMIVMLHLLSRGGALWDTVQYSPLWFISWAIEALCFCATNCFFLISGYFLSESSGFKWKRVLDLLIHVWAYSIVIFFIVLACGFHPTKLQILNSFLPFYSKAYWFINAYILLYILHPFINRLLKSLGQKEYKRLLLILFIFFSLAQSITPRAAWTMDESLGYGIIWSVCLYIFAAYFRRFGIPEKASAPGCFAGYIICATAVTASRAALMAILEHFKKDTSYAEIWYAYNSVPVFAASLFLFFIFLDLDIKKGSSAVSSLAGASLGVYLIHEQPFLRDYLWREILHTDSFNNKTAQPVMDLLAGAAVFALCLAVSWLAEFVIRQIRSKKAAKTS